MSLFYNFFKKMDIAESIGFQLCNAIIAEDYSKAIDIISKKSFDPNERLGTWKMPIISYLIYLYDKGSVKDENTFRLVLKSIVKLIEFDPNATDDSGETILMEIASNAEFNWLVPFILIKKNLDLSKKNDLGYDVMSIANMSHNTVMVDVLMAYKSKNLKHLPVNLKGKEIIKQIDLEHENEFVINKLIATFCVEQKKRPTSLYNLLMNFFTGKYDECIEIIRDVNFNPNESDRLQEPVVTSFIYYTQDIKANYDEEMLKKVVIEIVNHPRFDVNLVDCEGNSVLMVSMGYPKLNWLTEILFNKSNARLDLVNDLGEDLKEIADNVGNGHLYNALVAKSFASMPSIS